MAAPTMQSRLCILCLYFKLVNQWIILKSIASLKNSKLMHERFIKHPYNNKNMEVGHVALQVEKELHCYTANKPRF